MLGSISFLLLLSSVRNYSNGRNSVIIGDQKLKSILNRVHRIYFEEHFPIAQFMYLSNTPYKLKRIAAVSKSDRSFVVQNFQEQADELRKWIDKYSSLSGRNQIMIAKEVLRDINDLMKDDLYGWYPYLSENFMSGIYATTWQYVVLGGKLLNYMGGPANELARKKLLDVYELTSTWIDEQINEMIDGVQGGLVMAQGATERTIFEIETQLVTGNCNKIDLLMSKSSKYFKMAFLSTSINEQTIAVNVIEKLIKSWCKFATFLKEDYLPVTKHNRSYSTPGLSALGISYNN